MSTPQPWVYAEHQCTVASITDGDTLTAVIDVGFNLGTRQRFRLLGYNAPEMHARQEHTRAIMARDALDRLIAGRRVQIRSWRGDSFGRWLADLSVRAPSGELVDVVPLLIAEGWGVAWDGKPPAPKPWLAWPSYPLVRP